MYEVHKIFYLKVMATQCSASIKVKAIAKSCPLPLINPVLFFNYRQRQNFVSSIFDLLDVMCEQHHRTAVNPFLNVTKKR